MSLLLRKEWGKVSNIFDLEIIAPYSLELKSGKVIVVPVLLKNFGAKNGMLLVTDYDLIEEHTEEILDLNYGFSTLTEPRKEEAISEEIFLEIFNDWGWSGSIDEKPNWLND